MLCKKKVYSEKSLHDVFFMILWISVLCLATWLIRKFSRDRNFKNMSFFNCDFLIYVEVIIKEQQQQKPKNTNLKEVN